MEVLVVWGGRFRRGFTFFFSTFSYLVRMRGLRIVVRFVFVIVRRVFSLEYEGGEVMGKVLSFFVYV